MQDDQGLQKEEGKNQGSIQPKHGPSPEGFNGQQQPMLVVL